MISNDGLKEQYKTINVNFKEIAKIMKKDLKLTFEVKSLITIHRKQM